MLVYPKYNFNFMKKISTILLFLSPIVSGASGIIDFINKGNNILNSTVIPLCYSIALFYFGWGVEKYIRSEGKGNAKEEGRKVMVWGVVAMFILLSISGIIVLIRKEIKLPEKNVLDSRVTR